MPEYINLSSKKVDTDIELMFENWESENETVVIFSPHDDDGLLGAGYMINTLRKQDIPVYVVIFCSGNAGYSISEKKDCIVELRKAETYLAYEKIGIDKEHILLMNYSDFSALQHLGWKLQNGELGAFCSTVTLLRKLKATRLLIPNPHKEHIDHTATYITGSYDGVQAGDPIVADWGEPFALKNMYIYSVWADFSPEDALVHNRKEIRATHAIKVSDEIEVLIMESLRSYSSQAEIIENLMVERQKRKVKGGYIELYLSHDPRPKLDYSPYAKLVNEIIK